MTASARDRLLSMAGAAAAFVLGLALVAVVARVVQAEIAEGPWATGAGRVGALPFVLCTLVTAVGALVLAVPVALGVAAYLTDLGPARFRNGVRTSIELLAAVPSVIYGLWGALWLAPLVRDTLGGGPLGAPMHPAMGLISASLVLAVMLVPTMTYVARDVLGAVPENLRESALALGARPWDVFRRIVLPNARSGLTAAVLIGASRALGEAVAVAAVVGSHESAASTATGPLGPGHTIASALASPYGRTDGMLRPPVLAELALVLLVVTFAFNVGARRLVARMRRQAEEAV